MVPWNVSHLQRSPGPAGPGMLGVNMILLGVIFVEDPLCSTYRDSTTEALANCISRRLLLDTAGIRKRTICT